MNEPKNFVKLSLDKVFQINGDSQLTHEMLNEIISSKK